MTQDIHSNSEHPLSKLSDSWRILGDLGYIDTIFNHISIAWLHPDGGLQVTINPDGYLPAEVRPDRMITFSITGSDVFDARSMGINPDGFQLHSTIHRVRMKTGVALHTHSPYSLAVGATSCGLLPLSQTAMEFVDDITYIDYTGLFRHLAENRIFVDFCIRGGIAFLRNHGTLIVVEHIEEAVYIQHFLEEACKIQTATLSQNQKLVVPPEEVVKGVCTQLKQDRYQEAVKLFSAFRRNLLR